MAGFKIAAAQVASVRGDVAGNVRTHAAAIVAAGEQKVSVLVFPELSLTGYEPDLAAELAIAAADERLTPLAELARENQMTVVVGAPLATDGTKPALGAIIFAADGPPRTYVKMHSGSKEQAFFTFGNTPLSVATGGQTIGLAICADTTQPSHPQAYAVGGCTVYAAGVFFDAEWYPIDAPRLAGYAVQFGMLVVMANHAASVGTHTSVGKSAIWAPGGALLVEARDTENCLVVAERTGDAWSGEVVLLEKR